MTPAKKICLMCFVFLLALNLSPFRLVFKLLLTWLCLCRCNSHTVVLYFYIVLILWQILYIFIPKMPVFSSLVYLLCIMPLYISLPSFLSIFVFVCLLYIYLLTIVRLSVYPSICLSIHLSIHPSIFLLTYLLIHPSIYLSQIWRQIFNPWQNNIFFLIQKKHASMFILWC